MKQQRHESNTNGTRVQTLQGLSTHDVAVQRALGKGVILPSSTGRTYTQIVREDVFTPINNLFFVLCTALLLLGQISEAIVSAGTVLFNVVISVAQEIRAKRALDRIALLARPRAIVMRDGQEQAIDPDKLVQDDVLILRPGDQIVVDGSIISEGQVEIDESLLTGESEPITKGKGDQLSSKTTLCAGTMAGTNALTGWLTKQSASLIHCQRKRQAYACGVPGCSIRLAMR